LEIAGRRTDGPLLAWTLALQGQLAEQRGDSDAAVRAYRASLQQANDLTTRLALVDALLARREVGAVADLLRDAPPVDGVLVRRWLMTQGVGERATLLEEQLAQRFNEARARGEFLHAREAADFALARGHHDEALQLARDNWRTQREPADLLVLARAARAAGDTIALNEVRATLRRTGLQDVRIERVLGAGKGVTV
jgi:tetratricopeptide (TPR) repeat protein